MKLSKKSKVLTKDGRIQVLLALVMLSNVQTFTALNVFHRSDDTGYFAIQDYLKSLCNRTMLLDASTPHSVRYEVYDYALIARELYHELYPVKCEYRFGGPF